ncbi:pleckstrin homology domain-containing family N member 1 [Nycticebus coucang]|uniref:pleckstrin homology domain-containing family N member 1 n=1 Tax=Nycticebus coucang TaxID=9470 RepID=UPI00234E1057|nr:pleckstrin homology domain-containing family N member 1 [Nycticebus coucang]
MGNSHCVPQAPQRLRASFSRKPSLKGNREDSSRKLAIPFSTQAACDGDTTTDKLFCYIPGTDIPGLESQPETLEQPFLSVFKKARRRVPVRSLGKVVHYAKVQLRFQHSQDISDCYLELFPSHLYFQAHNSEGLTFQGLLPLMELSVCPLEGSREHAFQITGPLPTPLLLLCPSEAELGLWLYHLEKQMALVRGLRCCHSAAPQGSSGDELPWTLQRHLIRPPLQTLLGPESVGRALCASRVKLQHLPSKEQYQRLLVLYPTSLAIFSEEPDGLCFKGELPLSAISFKWEEQQVHSFLIEGPLINTICVVCASYQDYSHWLLCLQTVTSRDRSLLSCPEGIPECQVPPQVVGSSRGSLTSDGQTSWDLGCPAPPSSHTSHSLPESSVSSSAGCPVQPAPDQTNPDCTSISRRRAELRSSGSGQSSRSKAWAEGPSTAASPRLYLDLSELSRTSLEGSPKAPAHAAETPHSPLYADPYTPPATSHRKITDARGLIELSSAMWSLPGPVPFSLFPSISVSVPVSDPGPGSSSSPRPPDPYLLSKKGALWSQASQRHRGSVKDQGLQPPDSTQVVSEGPTFSGQLGLPKPTKFCLPTDGRTPRGHEDPGCHSIWDKTSFPSHQKWPQLGEPEAGMGVIQWI